MSQTNLTETAVFLLRVALGIMFIAHSLILKLFVFTLPGTAQFFVSIGLPGWLAYVIFLAEAVAGLFLVLGIQTRWVALATVADPGRGHLGAFRQRMDVRLRERRLGIPGISDASCRRARGFLATAASPLAPLSCPPWLGPDANAKVQS